MSASATKLWLGGLSLAASCALASAAFAGGFAAQEISVEGVGRANSGEAAVIGAAAQWWNPAAIAHSPREVSLGVQRRDVSTTLTDNGSTITRPIPPAGLTTPVGGSSRVADGMDDFTAWNGAAAVPIGDRFALGLAVEHPFRLKGDYGADGWGRYDTVRNRIDVVDVQLTGAVRLTEWLDLGLGVDAQRMKAALDTASPNLVPGSADGLQSLKGDAWDYGWTIGAQAHAEGLTVGASYRSAVKHKLDGSLSLSGLIAPLDAANFSAPADTTFSTPWSLAVAARYALTPRLTLEGQLVRSGWSEYDNIAVTFAGISSTIPQNYKDTTSIAVGADFALNQDWTLRGGVQFDPTPTPDDLREPGVADADRWIYAVGASRKLGAATVHAALSYADYKSAAIHDDTTFYAGTPAETTAALRGRFSGHTVTGALGLDWTF